MSKAVAVLGASTKPERYAYKAVGMLLEQEFAVYPVNPVVSEVLGVKCYPSLKDIDAVLDTITVYLSPKVSTGIIDEIVGKKPARIILNPGAENDLLKESVEKEGINVLEACTLVLLSTGQF
jgi:uncharacterized protein